MSEIRTVTTLDRDAPRLVAGQPVSRRAALRLIVEVEVAERCRRGEI